MFVQFKDKDDELAMVRIESIDSILVTKDGRYMVNFVTNESLELTQESAQELADKLTGGI